MAWASVCLCVYVWWIYTYVHVMLITSGTVVFYGITHTQIKPNNNNNNNNNTYGCLTTTTTTTFLLLLLTLLSLFSSYLIPLILLSIYIWTKVPFNICLLYAYYIHYILLYNITIIINSILCVHIFYSSVWFSLCHVLIL